MDTQTLPSSCPNQISLAASCLPGHFRNIGVLNIRATAAQVAATQSAMASHAAALRGEAKPTPARFAGIRGEGDLQAFQRISSRTRAYVSTPNFVFFAALVGMVAVLCVAFLIVLQSNSPHIDWAESQVDFNVRGGSPVDRETYLAQMLREHRREVDSQIRFITHLVRNVGRPSDAELVAQAIVLEALRFGYDPLFVAAVVRAESTFNQNARSSKGALGLMQLLPSTGMHISKIEDIGWQGVQHLNDPSYNVRLGLAYLRHLQDRFKGNTELALIAYNWGPAKLNSALRERSHIPASTANYAQKIFSLHKKWKNDMLEREIEFRIAANPPPRHPKQA